MIPTSILGVSVWVTILLDKYLSCRPTYRLLADLKTQGRDLALGTVTDGLQRLVPLFEPVYEALAAHSRQQPLWHGDETRWQVFATVEGKVGFRWYLWVFHSAAVVVFVLAQGRAHDVPAQYLGPQPRRIWGYYPETTVIGRFMKTLVPGYKIFIGDTPYFPRDALTFLSYQGEGDPERQGKGGKWNLHAIRSQTGGRPHLRGRAR